jgi:hypothetical protein
MRDVRKIHAAPLLRDVVLAAVPPKQECVFRDVLQRVRDDYGTVSERQVQRAIALLLARRKLRRVGTIYEGTYARP